MNYFLNSFILITCRREDALGSLSQCTRLSLILYEQQACSSSTRHSFLGRVLFPYPCPRPNKETGSKLIQHLIDSLDLWDFGFKFFPRLLPNTLLRSMSALALEERRITISVSLQHIPLDSRNLLSSIKVLHNLRMSIRPR